MENNVNNPSTFDEIRSQYNIYKQQYDSLWEHFGNNDNPISEEESHFISNMYHCREFQLEHHIILTSEQNEACIKWFDEDNDFELWFAGSGVEIDHEPTYIDYLITDSLELKSQVDEYILSRLDPENMSDEELSQYNRDCNKLEFNKYRLRENITLEEEKDCLEWINSDHDFWTNPMHIAYGNGFEMNYIDGVRAEEDIFEDMKKELMEKQRRIQENLNEYEEYLHFHKVTKEEDRLCRSWINKGYPFWSNAQSNIYSIASDRVSFISKLRKDKNLLLNGQVDKFRCLRRYTDDEKEIVKRNLDEYTQYIKNHHVTDDEDIKCREWIADVNEFFNLCFPGINDNTRSINYLEYLRTVKKIKKQHPNEEKYQL